MPTAVKLEKFSDIIFGQRKRTLVERGCGIGEAAKHVFCPGQSPCKAGTCSGKLFPIFGKPVFPLTASAVSFLRAVVPKIVKIKMEQDTEIKVAREI